MNAALSMASAGVLVFGTIHTNSAAATIDRFINVFPTKAQTQVASMLSESLRMVVSQQLVQNAERNARVAVLEILVNKDAVATMIRAGRTHQLTSVIQSGKREGMRSLDNELERLMRDGTILPETAFRHSIDKTRFQAAMQHAA